MSTRTTTNREIEACIKACIECHQSCTEMVMHCLKLGGEHADPSHMQTVKAGLVGLPPQETTSSALAMCSSVLGSIPVSNKARSSLRSAAVRSTVAVPRDGLNGLFVVAEPSRARRAFVTNNA
ncbi:hypothetical protein [Sorangium sp. So ce854]|uniref:hypothetical protein n=1 Tax=Sorangium sp. So ce854 TaxID=3133322 RepID=UPI003F61EE10